MTAVALVGASVCFAQELPFSRFLGMGPGDFINEGFTYDFNKNSYVLKKRDFWGGAEFRAKKKNYTITVQQGVEGIAWVKVQFTNPDAFHRIISYIQENDIECRETHAGGIIKMHFRAGDYQIEMEGKPVKKTNVYSTEDGTYSRIHDISHENFTYTIKTGKEPSSPWLDKQQKKTERKKKRGSKAGTISDYM